MCRLTSQLACGRNLKASNNSLGRTNSEKVHLRRQENCLILVLLSPQFADAQNQNNEKISIGIIPEPVSPVNTWLSFRPQEGVTYQGQEVLQATWKQP
jgi:hypothetical protein